VGCGVCDTPELWRGAAGLCARVCACAGAAESLHTYIHTNANNTHTPQVRTYLMAISGISYSSSSSPPPCLHRALVLSNHSNSSSTDKDHSNANNNNTHRKVGP